MALPSTVCIHLGHDTGEGIMVPTASMLIASDERPAYISDSVPHIVAQFNPGELSAEFEAVWSDDEYCWLVGPRVKERPVTVLRLVK